MNLISEGAYTNNVDLINKGTNKLNLVASEINKATNILENK